MSAMSSTPVATERAFDTSGRPAMLGRVDDMRRRLLAPALALALLVGGCSGDEADDEAAEPPGQAGAPTLRQHPADLDVRIARVAGHLPKATARDVSQRLGRVVATWFDGAFLTGDYPREHFAGYASFTRDAARLARRSAGITSNVRLGPRWVEVVPTRRVVRLHVFAPGHRASGATASVELVMVGIGSAGDASELAVTGDLYLTKTDAGWRIFGFDLNRSVGEPGDFAGRSGRRDRKGDRSDRQPPKRPGQHERGSR
jgi:hypothetical protein